MISLFIINNQLWSLLIPLKGRISVMMNIARKPTSFFKFFFFLGKQLSKEMLPHTQTPQIIITILSFLFPFSVFYSANFPQPLQ